MKDVAFLISPTDDERGVLMNDLILQPVLFMGAADVILCRHNGDLGPRSHGYGASVCSLELLRFTIAALCDSGVGESCLDAL